MTKLTAGVRVRTQESVVSRDVIDSISERNETDDSRESAKAHG